MHLQNLSSEGKLKRESIAEPVDRSEVDRTSWIVLQLRSFSNAQDVTVRGESDIESELTSRSREFEITSGDNILSPIILHSSDAPHDHPNKYGEPHPHDKQSNY